jgi:hypothetical protein
MELTGTEFLERLLGLVNSWWPARTIVEQALAKRYEIHSSGKIIVFEQGCPWKEHLFEIEKEVPISTSPLSLAPSPLYLTVSLSFSLLTSVSISVFLSFSRSIAKVRSSMLCTRTRMAPGESKPCQPVQRASIRERSYRPPGVVFEMMLSLH